MIAHSATKLEVLRRMRAGDFPKRFDYGKSKFDDGTLVSAKVMTQLLRAGSVSPAAPNIGASYTLMEIK